MKRPRAYGEDGAAVAEPGPAGWALTAAEALAAAETGRQLREAAAEKEQGDEGAGEPGPSGAGPRGEAPRGSLHPSYLRRGFPPLY